jgi:sugar diacid utilization regulator
VVKVQELVGRITALDPEASHSLKVIAYFDALVEGHASAEVMLRGAAVLGGCPAGFVSEKSLMRVGADGARSPIDNAPADEQWTSRTIEGASRAWLERTGAPHANDEMILERLAIALSITLERSAPRTADRKAVEALLDETESAHVRSAALSRLRIDTRSLLRVDALPAALPGPEGLQTVLATPVGALRAVVRTADAEIEATRAGIGLTVGADSLHRSWNSAVIALRLTSDREPVLRADDLGAFLLIAEAAELHPEEQPDVTALRRVLGGSERVLAIVEAVTANESLRAAAAELGLHHSTLQSRATEISADLGFDIRSPSGRTRLVLALRLYLLETNRFD